MFLGTHNPSTPKPTTVAGQQSSSQKQDQQSTLTPVQTTEQPSNPTTGSNL